MTREIKSYNHYMDRLLKLIPTEIVAAYLYVGSVLLVLWTLLIPLLYKPSSDVAQ